jgi:DNA repair photolyase
MPPVLNNNPPNPFHHSQVEWIDAPEETLQVYEEQARSILSENDSPDISFRYSLNPYRGCFHACAYCYARPSHHYLDFGAGTDFERKIVAKVNAPALLRETFMRPRWQGEPIVFSGNTDCYQPLELSYALTRGCLEVCREFKNPVFIITKGAIIRRDIDLLKELHRCASVHVTMSIAFSDDELSRLIEPGAPRPSVRFRALEELAAA